MPDWWPIIRHIQQQQQQQQHKSHGVSKVGILWPFWVYLDQIFFCDPVVIESIWYRTRTNRLINEGNTTGGLKIFWTGPALGCVSFPICFSLERALFMGMPAYMHNGTIFHFLLLFLMRTVLVKLDRSMPDCRTGVNICEWFTCMHIVGWHSFVQCSSVDTMPFAVHLQWGIYLVRL